jgi:Na+/melibiose symporter-like transporter
MSAKDCARAILRNPPLLCSMLIELFRYIAFMIYVSTMAYYFKWVLKDMAALTTVMTACTAVCFASSLIAPWLGEKLGKKNASILAMGLFAIGLLIPRFFFEGNIWIYAICICLGYFGSALQVCVGIVMYSKDADYYQWKTGIKAHGFIMSIYVWPVEIGIALSTIIIGIVLSAIHYDATATALTASQITGVKNLVLLIPGLLYVVATVIAAMHPLSEKKIAEIHQDMKSRGMSIAADASFEEV